MDGCRFLELLCEGLTFDFGFVPLEKMTQIGKLSGLSDSSDPDEGLFEILCFAVSAHLEAGVNRLPILRPMMALGATLATEIGGCAAVVWQPSRRCVAPRAFADSIDRWLAGGGLPVPELVDFRPALDGGIESLGLAFFHGQELRLEPELAAQGDVAIRVAARLADHMMLSGRLEQTEQVTAPDGTPLRLSPSANGKMVRVWLR